ncbi:POK10 protein, partial [Notiomystis cincta]|nr:POK10 protein [Notiomystis cincta]
VISNTGIPHVSTGQAIVERAHRTLKDYLTRQKSDGDIDSVGRLNKVLFTLNFLSVMGDAEIPPVVMYYNQIKMQAVPEIQLMYKNPTTGVWEGP